MYPAQGEKSIAEPEAQEEGEAGEVEAAEPEGPGALEGALVTRTPVPTATTGFLVEGVSQIAEEAGLAGESFLGLAVEDRFVLVISLLLVLAGYLPSTLLLFPSYRVP